ncbi:hypothetical protein D3C87_1480500 [compost metagenome]
MEGAGIQHIHTSVYHDIQVSLVAKIFQRFFKTKEESGCRGGVLISLDGVDEVFVRMTFNQTIDMWHGAVHDVVLGLYIFQYDFFVTTSFSIK